MLRYKAATVQQTQEAADTASLSAFSRLKQLERLISYAVGCMMGRYSLDKPGLVYPHSGGQGFAPGQYQTFPADEDGIIPLTDLEWFDDDAANRLEKFIATAWPGNDSATDQHGLNTDEDSVSLSSDPCSIRGPSVFHPI